MLVPEEFASPITCAMHGQAYVAGTAIGRNLAQSDRIKVVCRPRQPTEPPIAERDDDQLHQAAGVIKQAEKVRPTSSEPAPYSATLFCSAGKA